MMSRTLQQAEIDEARRACGNAWDAVAKFRGIAKPTVDDVIAMSLALTLASFDARLMAMGFQERMDAKKRRPALVKAAASEKEGETGKDAGTRRHGNAGSEGGWLSNWQKEHEGG